MGHAWLHYDTHRPAEGAVRAHVPQANVPRHRITQEQEQGRGLFWASRCDKPVAPNLVDHGAEEVVVHVYV